MLRLKMVPSLHSLLTLTWGGVRGCTCSLYVLCSDDDNRIVLEALPDEVTGDDGDQDYVNAFMGDYINASYIDVWVTVDTHADPA